jgi:hypothetical protein
MAMSLSGAPGAVRPDAEDGAAAIDTAAGRRAVQIAVGSRQQPPHGARSICVFQGADGRVRGDLPEVLLGLVRHVAVDHAHAVRLGGVPRDERLDRVAEAVLLQPQISQAIVAAVIFRKRRRQGNGIHPGHLADVSREVVHRLKPAGLQAAALQAQGCKRGGIAIAEAAGGGEMGEQNGGHE